MINVADFYDELIRNNIDFFVGIPDSLLKNICAFITAKTAPERNIITANEGNAIALGAGYHIGTNKIPLIYMQNSGLGNAINPLISLADKDVYSIPMILLIGWRGEPNVKDEPQHTKQGRITPALLDDLEIPFQILDEFSNVQTIIKTSVETAKKISAPVAILVRKGTFSNFSLSQESESAYKLTREEAIEEVLKHIPADSVIVSTTGMLSRELFEIRERNGKTHETDFLTVGSMGHTSQIALGLALATPDKIIFCFDGDGSAIMHLGGYAIAGNLAPKNLKIILFNNGAHDSVGGQPTVGRYIDFSKIVDALSIENFGTVINIQDFLYIFPKILNSGKVAFLEIKIRKGARKDLGRPNFTPQQNKEILKSFLSR